MTSNLKYYRPGDLVYQGKPFVRVISKDMWDKVCAGCLKRDNHLLFCKNCRILKYCGKTCQKRAWSDHKIECPLLKNYKDHRQQLLVQLIGNVIMKLKGKSWKAVTEKVMGADVTFDDLFGPPMDSLTMQRHDGVVFEIIKTALAAYIGKENMPCKDELDKLLGKVIYNQFMASDVSMLFLGIAKFDVSCVPNCSRKCNFETLSIRAIKTIRKESEQLTISVLPFMFSASDIQVSSVQDCLTERGKCMDCSQPYGHSPLTKIINMTECYLVIKETVYILRLASLLMQLKRPLSPLISREQVKLLLQKQKGVLGDTNLLRIRTLALKCFLLEDTPTKEMVGDFKNLITWMKAAFGENCPELIPVHQRLMEISFQLLDFQTAENERDEVARLKRICFGIDGTNYYREEFQRELNRIFLLSFLFNF